MSPQLQRRSPKLRSLSRATTVQPARPSQLREMNCRTLLRLLRAHSPCSRADLVRLSGLAAPTVSLATSQLANLGLVEAVGEGESSGGRPPALLRFNAAHGYVAGADIGGTRLRMVLADLDGHQVAQWATEMSVDQKTPAAVVCLLHDGLAQMCREHATAKGRVLHLTAGAPGITDVGRGMVLAAPNLSDWNNVPLKEMLEQETGVPSTIENDTNLAAVGEYARGAASGVENFIFVAIGTGVGAGIFLRGALHHGADWAAGEIGYLAVNGIAGNEVKMRETGQLERAIGGMGIEARWQEVLQEGRPCSDPERVHARAPHILDLAAQGDPEARLVLDSTARLLAGALTNVALLYNPELIVLGGGVGSHPALCRVTQQLLEQQDFAVPDLRSSLLGTKAQLHGAISLSLASVEAKLLC